jgi:hypothetical protein
VRRVEWECKCFIVRRVFKPCWIAVFIGVVATTIIITGYLFKIIL